MQKKPGRCWLLPGTTGKAERRCHLLHRSRYAYALRTAPLVVKCAYNALSHDLRHRHVRSA